MGGSAGPRSAALAARYADEYNTAVRDARTMSRERARGSSGMREGRARAAAVLDHDRRARRRATTPSCASALGRLAAVTGGDAGGLLSEPPPAWIIATLDEAAEQIAALRDAGVAG